MGAAGVVEAFVGDAQVFEDSTLDQGFFHDAGDVRQLHMAVPDPLRIDDDDGTVLALVEAAGVVGAAFGPRQTAAFHLGFEGVAELFGLSGVTAPAAVARLAMVTADEKMRFKGGHEGLFSRMRCLKKGEFSLFPLIGLFN